MMNPNQNMARGKTHEAPIAKLLAVALFVSLTGTGLTQATEVEHQTSPNGYVSQFGPGFSEVEIVSSAQGLMSLGILNFTPALSVWASCGSSTEQQTALRLSKMQAI